MRRWYVRYTYKDYEGDVMTAAQTVCFKDLFNLELFSRKVSQDGNTFLGILGLWEIAANEEEDELLLN